MATATGRQVLVVEDDDSLRPALARLLAAAGFQVLAYASAEVLLADGTTEDAACVVSDLKLPALSGFELLAELRARDAETPLILITAHDAPGLREEAARRLTSPNRFAAPICWRLSTDIVRPFFATY